MSKINFENIFSTLAKLEGDHINRQFQMYYVVVGDNQWPEFLETTDCSRRLGLARIFQSVLFKGDSYWSTYDTHNFDNEYRTQVFYVAAVNCHRSLHAESPWLPKVWIEMKAFNDGEHFSQEDWGLLSIHYIMFVIFILFLGYSSYGYFKEIKKEGNWESPMAILVIALIFEFFQIVSKLMDLNVYEFDGEGIPTLDLISTI